MDWIPGREFEIVNVSIDPRETPRLAAEKKAAYLSSYGRPEAGNGWHFLTGTEEQIKKLASQVGFGYRYDKRDQQYAHSAVLFALTPEGKISRYLYGIEYRPKDFRLALLEASSGKIGTVIDRLLLFCYRYDPITRKYSMVITKVLQFSSLVTVLLLGGYLVLFWRRQDSDSGQLKKGA
jgi:protein SCO1/2